MAKSKSDVLKEGFQNKCKVINLKYEYEGYIGEEQWAIVSELTEKELLEKYPDIVSHYIPFVLLSVEQQITEEYEEARYQLKMKLLDKALSSLSEK